MSLTELFQDLPEMDFTTPDGDSYQKLYWRGYRTNIGSPYLVMIDGVIFNNLYFNEVTSLASFPLSYIDKVEIVYGHAASVYGPNAFTPLFVSAQIFHDTRQMYVKSCF